MAAPHRVATMAVAVAAVAVVLGVFALTFWGGDDDAAGAGPEPLLVVADAPVYETLEELIAASDHIVEARIVAVEDGRSVTNPADPDTGVQTRLVHLEVVETFGGHDVGDVVLEEEATLLDGTAVVVNGVEAADVGDVGFFFLGGGGGEFPYTALVNEQGRYLVVDDGLRPANDRTLLATRIGALSPAELRAALRTAQPALLSRG